MNSQIELINNQIKLSHNPELVIKNESPNSNTIYHIYEDGEITSQKGGFAYLQRSEFTSHAPINIGPKKQVKFDFPLGLGSKYAIVTESDAIIIRNMMIGFYKNY